MWHLTANRKTTVTQLIAHIYETARALVGKTTTEGVYIAGERIIAGDCSGPQRTSRAAATTRRGGGRRP